MARGVSGVTMTVRPALPCRLRTRPLTSPHLTSPSLSTGSPEPLPQEGEAQAPERPGGIRMSTTRARTLLYLGPSQGSHRLAPSEQGVRPVSAARLPPPTSLLNTTIADPIQGGSILSPALIGSSAEAGP